MDGTVQPVRLGTRQRPAVPTPPTGVVHPARWIIDPTTLPAQGTAWPQWRAAWQRHHHQRHLPQQVLVGDDHIRLRLDLDDHAPSYATTSTGDGMPHSRTPEHSYTANGELPARHRLAERWPGVRVVT